MGLQKTPEGFRGTLMGFRDDSRREWGEVFPDIKRSFLEFPEISEIPGQFNGLKKSLKEVLRDLYRVLERF